MNANPIKIHSKADNRLRALLRFIGVDQPSDNLIRLSPKIHIQRHILKATGTVGIDTRPEFVGDGRVTNQKDRRRTGPDESGIHFGERLTRLKKMTSGSPALQVKNDSG